MIRRLSGAVTGAIVLGVFGFADPAAAHVTVEPREAIQGGYARVVFRVPNERDNASTTKVEIHLPEDDPITGVRTMPVPGWKVEVKTRKLDQPIDRNGQQIDTVVGSLTWIAVSKNDAIAPNTFMEFPVSLGPLPETDVLVFKALQTYGNGEVVRWIEEPPADGGEEPEHPAPALRLAKAPAAEGAPTEARDAQDGVTGADQDDPTQGTPLWLGIAGLAAGLLGLLLGGVAWFRTRPEVEYVDADRDADDPGAGQGGEPKLRRPAPN